MKSTIKKSALLCSLIVLAGLFFAPASSLAQVPQLINYQGRVAVSGTNFTGPGQFKFALVSGTGAGTSYWSNDATSTAGSQPTNAVGLAVTKGSMEHHPLCALITQQSGPAPR